MPRRILFACAACDTALVWPVDADPTCAVSGPVADGHYGDGLEVDGRPAVLLTPEARWRVRFDRDGRAVCPGGHIVGAAVSTPYREERQIGLLAERVVTREMRGRP